MGFTAANKRDGFGAVMPLWVEKIQEKYPKADFRALRNADLIDNYPKIIIVLPSQSQADRVKETCGHSLQANWPNSQIIYRFEQWNRPACKKIQHQILLRYDPTHVEESCDCPERYGCNA